MTAMIGDIVKVVRGKKLHHGKIGKVVKKFAYLDQFDRLCTAFIVLDDGSKTCEDNVEVIQPRQLPNEKV